jgi:GT2 family glycosyltransferase
MPDRPLISLIIPKYNRLQALARSLDSLFAQTCDPSLYEIILIDDGSSEDIKGACTSYDNKEVKFTYLRQENRGPAAARNLGIKHALGGLVLILNDDLVADTNLVAEHLKSHEKYPEECVGVLGYFTWSREIEITAFMHWLENGGPYFCYSLIKGEWASWRETWTCNISFKKSFVVDCGLFDEDFKYPAWEDFEFGYRMSLRGYRLLYNPRAIGYHYHPTTLQTIRQKMRWNGNIAGLLAKKIKDETLLTPLAVYRKARFWTWLDSIVCVRPVVWLAEALASACEKKIAVDWLYNALLAHYRIEGRRESLRQNV